MNDQTGQQVATVLAIVAGATFGVALWPMIRNPELRFPVEPTPEAELDQSPLDAIVTSAFAWGAIWLSIDMTGKVGSYLVEHGEMPPAELLEYD